MNKRLYTAFSFFELLWTLSLRLACVFGLVYSMSHYEENPVIITIVAGICLLFIFILGDDQIIVYSDKITQTTNSFSSLVFKSKGKTYEIEEIKRAYLQPSTRSNSLEIGAAVLLSLVFPKTKATRDKTQPIYFDLKNGRTVKFDTNLELSKMRRIVDIVNSLTK